MDSRIQTFVNTGEKLLTAQHAHSPQVQRHISELKNRWSHLKDQIKTTRNLINLSIPYFELVEEVLLLSFCIKFL